MGKNRNKKLAMHLRNPLRIPPDYTKLAIKHKDFRQVCTLELNGKVSVDFHNEQTLRELTKVLLLEYYDLRVEFAPGSLVPTLPLRLNYILWLEDLLAPLKLDSIRGIDIGCGSSCIYSLLAAKKNKWQMLALESKPTNIEYARENVKRNDLESLIDVYAQPDEQTIFKSYFDSQMQTDETEFQFCLCNPPFFDSNKSDPYNSNRRKILELPRPRTGTAEELTCAGGEVQFVQRIIDESLLYKDRVLIFTSMLGIKANVPTITDYLHKQNINNVIDSEFHQGQITRWAIAWSFKQIKLKT